MPFQVDVRIGGHVGVEVAHCAVHLAEDLDAGDLASLPNQAAHEDGYFLAERGGRRGLAVGAREHRLFGEALGQGAQAPDHAVELREQQLVAQVAKHERVGEIVDVLRRAREVDELRGPGEVGLGRDAFAKEVLDGFHVVVRGAFDFLHAARVGLAELVGEALERGLRRRREGRELGDARLGGERPQPGDLDAQAVADQPPLAGKGPERSRLLGVAPVEGRHRRERGEVLRIEAH